jgi:hypothetical protein
MFIRNESARITVRARAAWLAGLALLSVAACSKSNTPAKDSSATLMPAPADTQASTASAAATPVRGRITAMSDTQLTIATATGPQQIRIDAPLHVYTRTASDLAHVTPNAFVGITSVAQPDGSQRATEIHIFPEELRGTGEGSYLMNQSAGSAGSASTMTNGSVSAPRMTNGSVATSSGGKSYTIQYQGGTQTITVPAGVTVTAISATQTRPAVGSNVVVLAKKGADGSLTSSTLMLSGSSAPARVAAP